MAITHFDRIASQYENSLPSHINQHYLSKRVRFITSVLREGKLLDVGCGTGSMTLALSNVGFRSYGIDNSIEMLRLAERKQKGHHILASARDLPFSNASFHFVINIATLHHFADHKLIEQAIFEMLRVLRPGGFLLIWDHNPRNPYWKSLMKRVPQDSGEERIISHKEIVAILLKQKNIIKSIKMINSGFVPDFVPQSLMPVFCIIENIFEKTPLIKRISAHNVFLIQRSS
ncbi:MAG: class I SAM-dependent methyltransferase [Syntrophobacterales bacterium]|nr:class I SAM-dependent methyltransferase [Syntrophobacterales bacterium]